MEVQGPSPSRYDAVAREYYDARLHPTCSDFRRATAALLADFMPTLAWQTARMLEVGAGRSLVAEFLQEHGLRSLASLTISDASPGMLEYSSRFADAGAELCVGAVESLPFADGSFDALMACLGDPYNTEIFWAQVHRLLVPGGTCFFSTPSFDWSQQFRSSHSGSLETAEFAVGGATVALPSYILDAVDMARLISGSGLVLREARQLRAEDLEGGLRSAKLLAAQRAGLPIVSAYWIAKPL